MHSRFVDDEDGSPDRIPSTKGISSRKLRHNSQDFAWLGTPWTCRKRLRHYVSFSRNGVTISVNEFVYVMVEDNERHVAYVEDMYDDSRGRKKVLVRWFNKINEVGNVLPSNFNDREIFCTPCLQVLSVECVDGLATVLSPLHFDKYVKEARSTRWQPYLCHREIDNDDIKPYNITQLQGYWNQKILSYMYTSTQNDYSNHLPSPSLSNDEADLLDGHHNKIQKNHIESLRFNYGDVHLRVDGNAKGTSMEIHNFGGSNPFAYTQSAVSLPKFEEERQQQLSANCPIEVLSQDSGIRGCWFRGVVLKKRKDKMKIRYLDLQNAEETGSLEEWVLASRVASPDRLGLRLCGRHMVRPSPAPNNRCTDIDIGSFVDAWWHDGWWEGLVIHMESQDLIHVYFPGEQKTSVFGSDKLRSSQEWVNNKWIAIKNRRDLAVTLFSRLDGQNIGITFKSSQVLDFERLHESTCPDGFNPSMASVEEKASNKSPNLREGLSSLGALSKPLADGKSEKVAGVVNLARDNSLASLRWNRSRKRSRLRESIVSLSNKRHSSGSSSRSSSSEEEDLGSFEHGFLIPKVMKRDRENCKSGFGATLPHLPNLVMSS
ncbi:uncharacterized protein LOC18429059 isoform X3 [Amborella trichopoda]|nr:uncharacterized protein LOC18429059 isoform X3 [Amborella trichopoda]|eukprot:XP_020519944.1 uncharacterized protein LOC18429059 isoform X3 [Amborella trichopoda]